LLLFLPRLLTYAQLGDLAAEIENAEGDVETIADSVIQIIKIIAGVALAIAGLSFLYLRNQENDLSKKAGQIVVGIAIFFVILAMVDVIRNL
jgi:sulfite exporter TauE/SafE